MLEDQRLAALVRFELSRATQIQGQIQMIDTEKANLERELAALHATPGGSAPGTPASATPRQASDVERIRCQDAPAAVERAVKIRQRELGAREGQPGAVPLTGFKAQAAEQIARDLAGQFAAWPEAATQVGLLASESTGSLEGFVDVPVPNVFRLYRQRSDGTLGIELFTAPGSATPLAYGETARRIEEATARQTGQTLADLLATRPAGPMRVLAQSGQFADARASLLAGNFADTAKIEVGAARGLEFQNYRGESVRLLETIAPGSSGLVTRRLVVLPKPNNQEQWEETVTQIRPISYWRTDVEVSTSRETRSAAGALVGARVTGTPVKLSVER